VRGRPSVRGRSAGPVSCRVPGPDRQLFIEVVFEDRTPREIAREQGCSAKWVRNRLSMVRGRVRDALRPPPPRKSGGARPWRVGVWGRLAAGVPIPVADCTGRLRVSFD
jgi:hypothetical protein